MSMRYDYDTGDPVLHKQVPVRVHSGPMEVRFEADEGMHDLIVALWRAGYRTVASCENQGGEGTAWVGFESEAQSIRFAEAIGEITVGTTRVLVPTGTFSSVYADSPFLQGATAVTFPAVALDQVTAHFTD